MCKTTVPFALRSFSRGATNDTNVSFVTCAPCHKRMSMPEINTQERMWHTQARMVIFSQS